MKNLLISSLSLLGTISALSAADPSVNFRLQVDTITSGYDPKTPYDAKYCWAQARAAAIPRENLPPSIIVTMQRLLLTGADVYGPINEMRSDDLGKTWQGPFENKETLGRIPQPDGIEIGTGDFVPKYHAKSGKVLGTGLTFHYLDNKGVHEDKNTVYSVYDPSSKQWSQWARLEVPEGDLHWKNSAGCAQRVDLPDGDILLPVSYKLNKDDKFWKVKVLLCGFNGEKLTCKKAGETVPGDEEAKLSEPSLTNFKGRYYLTMRSDKAGYVATSEDGMTFSKAQKWLWDDGTELGTYNTQSHWVTHDDALFLTYTRRGANNDHVFRHRAPLFIAEVDPKTMRVIRATERILLPDKGARYGNFGVCNVSANETWVVDTEWMQQPGPDKIIPVDNKWDAKGRVLAARILWDKPNTGWDRQ